MNSDRKWFGSAILAPLVLAASTSCAATYTTPDAPGNGTFGAQEEPPAPEGAPEEEGWGFVVTPYLFASGLKGTVGSGKATADIEAEFDDLVSDLNFGGMLSLEAAPPESPWSFLVDLIFVELENNGTSTGPLTANVDAEIDQFIGELSVAYAVADDGGFDLVGGIRYWDLSAELTADPTGTPTTHSGSANWVDPLIGFRSRLPLGGQFDLLLRGDVGGFGVGSDLAYNLGAGAGWSISKVVELALGYRYLYVDYRDDIVYDVAQSGLLLGCSLRF